MYLHEREQIGPWFVSLEARIHAVAEGLKPYYDEPNNNHNKHRTPVLNEASDELKLAITAVTELRSAFYGAQWQPEAAVATQTRSSRNRAHHPHHHHHHPSLSSSSSSSHIDDKQKALDRLRGEVHDIRATQIEELRRTLDLLSALQRHALLMDLERPLP